MAGPIQSAISSIVNNTLQTGISVKAAKMMDDKEKQNALDVAIQDAAEAEAKAEAATAEHFAELEAKEAKGDPDAGAFFEGIQEEAKEKAEKEGRPQDERLKGYYRDQLYAAEKGRFAESSRKKIYEENPYFEISRQYRLVRPSTVKEARQFLKQRQKAINEKHDKETK